ncbi:MAG: Ig-like domain-containing protein [Patescibacteria group bacterium]
MKKYFLLISNVAILIFIILLFGFIAPANLSAYSFEIYRIGEHAYPALLNATAIFDEASATVTITAEISDISGVYAKATIKNSQGVTVPGAENIIMQSADDLNFTAVCDTTTCVAGWSEGETYSVDIFATDFFGNSHTYVSAATFKILRQTEINPLQIIPSSARLNTRIVLMATLKYKNGTQDIIPNAAIRFYDNGAYKDTKQTDWQGVATFDDFLVTGNIGEHTIKAEYVGSSLNNAATKEETLTVLENLTVITDFHIDCTGSGSLVICSYVPVGTPIRLSAYLKTGTTPILGKTIIFTDETVGGVEIGRGNTGNSGLAYFDFVVQPDITIGYHTLKASFAGDPQNSPASAETLMYVPLKATEIAPLIATLPYPYAVGSPISFSGKLTYDAFDLIVDATPLPQGTPVRFIDITDPNNQITFDSVTDSNGVASGSFNAQWPAGVHTLWAIYSAGDGEHAPSFAVRTFNVNGQTQINPFLAYKPRTTIPTNCVKRNNWVRLEATLKFLDPVDSPISGQTVIFRDETRALELGSETTDSNGVAIFPYHMPANAALGDHTISADFSGNGSIYALAANTASFILEVKRVNGTCP